MRIVRGSDGSLLDRALVLVFPGPASATGEDLVELHCHGGRAVVEAVERALFAVSGVRRALPGEFTRRALLNGRIDLTEAEGLADLLEAETEQQRRSAVAAAEGQVSRALRGWLHRLAVLSAEAEASLDYAEEGDVVAEAASLEKVTKAQRILADEMGAVLAAAPVDRWRDGFRVVVAGPPNAGKSTLVNLLGARDAAIVSPMAGTTRDRVEVTVRRNGIGYVLTDTAGLNEGTDDPIERIGMDRSREAMRSADLVLWLGDDVPADGGSVPVWGKADLPGRTVPGPRYELVVSAMDLTSIERLWDFIEARSASDTTGDALPITERTRTCCKAAHAALSQLSPDPIILAEHLRLACRHLGGALGVDATEAMLDALFSRFCVGK